MKSVTKTIQIPETLEDFTKIGVFIDSLARLNDESNIKNAHARIDDRFGDVQTPDDRVKAHAVLDFFTICLAMVHALDRMPLGAFDQTISGVLSGVEQPYRKYAEMMWETLRAKNDNIYAYDVDVFPFCGINVGPGLMAAYYVGKPISDDLSTERALIEQFISEGK